MQRRHDARWGSAAAVVALAALAVTSACTPSSSPGDVAPPRAIATVLPASPTPVPPTNTPVPPTEPPATSTPPPPAISIDTVGRLALLTTFGQGESSRSVAFSPDGTTLATAAGNDVDFAIRLWEIPGGQPVGALEGNESIVWGLAFSPDGRFLASAARDGTIRVWDWRAGLPIQTLYFPSEVTSVVFSPGGQTLAVGGVDQWPNAAIWTYNVDTWQPQLQLAEFWNIPEMAYSPDGQWLAGGGTSRNVRVWRASDGAEQFVLYHSGQVSSVVISPDGTTLATGLCEASEANQCTRGGVWLWDLSTGRSIDRLSDFPDWVEGVAFSTDGSLILAGSRDGTLRAYAASDYVLAHQAFSPEGVYDLAVSPDGRYLAVGRADGRVDLWIVGP